MNTWIARNECWTKLVSIQKGMEKLQKLDPQFLDCGVSVMAQSLLVVQSFIIMICYGGTSEIFHIYHF